MRPEFQKEEPGGSTLSTATLAHADEIPTANTVIDRSIVNSEDRDFDVKPADQESRSIQAGNSRSVQRAVTEFPNPNGANGGKTAGSAAPQEASEADDERATPLFTEQEAKDFFARWDSLQVGFIDEPRRAVEQADSLVAGAMKRLAEIFAEERARLEGQWDRGDNVSTEDLRVAMRRYRSFFRRLLAV